MLELALAPTGMDRPLLLPPGAPADKLAALRAAFSKAMRDKAFVAESERLKIEIDEVSGEEVAKIIAEAFAAPPDVVKAAKEAMQIGK